MSINKSFKQFFAFFVLLLSVQFVSAQSGKANKETEIAQLIQSKNFVFKATSASPTGGRVWQLTSDYSFRVAEDTVRADLPYFGRAYSAPINPSDGGINFSSSQFDYKSETRKKGGWQILVQPKDHNDVRQMVLNVTKSGNATLQVFSNNRQPISFNGYITERRR